jgi:hypothetical protein
MTFATGTEAYARHVGRYALSAPHADAPGLRAGDTALDVGCGPGLLLSELARRLGSSASLASTRLSRLSRRRARPYATPTYAWRLPSSSRSPTAPSTSSSRSWSSTSCTIRRRALRRCGPGSSAGGSSGRVQLEHFDAYVESGRDEREFAAFPTILHAGERAPDGELTLLDGERIARGR